MSASRRKNQAERIIHLPPALSRLENDFELLRDLALFYIEDSPTLLQELERGIQTQDFDLITRSAHSLKGLAANFDAHRAVAAAYAVEISGRAQDLAATKSGLPLLQTETQLVVECLQSEVLQ